MARLSRAGRHSPIIGGRQIAPQSSGNQTISAPAAAVVVATAAPTIVQLRSITSPAAAVTVNALAPTILQPHKVLPPAAAVTVAGQVPTVLRQQAVLVTPPAAAIIVNPEVPRILLNGIEIQPVSRLGAGGAARKQKRPRVIVEIDGQAFPVADAQAAKELLQSARETAKTTAEAAAVKAQKKADSKTTEAGKLRALRVQPPEVKLVEPDYADELTQYIQAQVDATRAAIQRSYVEAYAAVAAQREAEDREVMQAIMDDDTAEYEAATALLKTAEDYLKSRRKRG